MNEKYFSAVMPRLAKANELVSFLALAGCKHVTIDVNSAGVGITAFPYDEETKDKVMGLMRMYAGKDDELNEEPHTGEYHSWWTCQLIYDYEKN